MSLKYLNDVQRISFLNEFTFQLMVNSIKDEELKRIIEVEKIRRKYIKQESSPQEFGRVMFDTEFEKFPRQPILKSFTKQSEQYRKSFFPAETSISLSAPRVIKPRLQPRPKLKLALQQKTMQQPTQQFLQKQVPAYQTQPAVELDSLKKLDLLMKDLAVQMIECPGPGKNLLVKVRNKINVTRIILNESEIRNVADYFSKNAKIPILEGILNAAFGSLLISAVVSEHAGSRFIITKKSPYELLEGINY
ncbi:MAG: hypothetical protein AABX77_01745 [Nanoarchaeota archaeon]